MSNTTRRRFRATAPEFVPESVVRQAIKNERRDMALKIASLRNPNIIKTLGKTAPVLNPAYNINIKAAYATRPEAYRDFLSKKNPTEEAARDIVNRVCKYNTPPETTFNIIDKLAINNYHTYLQQLISCLSKTRLQAIRTYTDTLLTYVIDNNIEDYSTSYETKIPRDIQLSIVQTILDKGVDVNESKYTMPSLSYDTPLYHAIVMLDLEIIQLLMANGAKILPKMNSGLHDGIINYIEKSNNMPKETIHALEEIIKILVNNGMDLNMVYDNAGMYTIGSTYREKSILQKLNDLPPNNRDLDYNRLEAVKEVLINYGAKALQSEEKRRPTGGKRTMRNKHSYRTRISKQRKNIKQTKRTS